MDIVVDNEWVIVVKLWWRVQYGYYCLDYEGVRMVVMAGVLLVLVHLRLLMLNARVLEGLLFSISIVWA